jgi:hypothetical protein
MSTGTGPIYAMGAREVGRKLNLCADMRNNLPRETLRINNF